MFNFEHLNKKYSQRPAYVCEENSLTYGELYAFAKNAATLLQKQGKSPVAVVGNKSPHMMILILACLMAGRAYVPLEDALPIARINSAIEQAGCTLVLNTTQRELNFSVPCSNLDTIEHAPCEQNPPKENNTAYIIFTSGSTGTPKGVPISYKNLENFIRWFCKQQPVDKYEKIAVFNPASFGFDLSVAGIYYSIACGHTIVTLSGEEQKSFDGIFKAISKTEPELFIVTPTFMRLCLLNGDFNEKNFPFVRCIWFCGERLEKSLCQKLFDRFPRLRIINAYGPTEATCAVCSTEITPADMEKGDPLPVGDITSAACKIEIENGEIVISGKSVFEGYVGTKQKSNGAFYTGDIGYMESGRLFCTGRADNLIKYKGFRIELGDIEANLAATSGVSGCAAVAKKGKCGETAYIKAFVSLEHEMSTEEIRSVLKSTLPEYMIPKVIEIVKELPVNEHGKLDRRRLEQLD